MKLTKRQKAELVGDIHVYGGGLMVATGSGLTFGGGAGLIVFGALLALLGLLYRRAKK